ncbi:MAG: FAD-binding protein [Acidobacteriota bacterium]|nr:FAD-binding protein [Acidobacteriota bacterium]
MADIPVLNWFGNATSYPAVVTDAHSASDIVAVLRDPATYPSPVRPVGSNHSVTACQVQSGGTMLNMKMDRILDIGTDTVTVEAGALYIDIAKVLEQHKLQFHVNTEIGNLTAGSAACCGTKDGSFPGEFGQVSSYVAGVKMVLPSGDVLEVTDAQPDLMRKVRCSYGTFGVIYEVTFRVKPLTPMAVHHKTFSLKDLIANLPDLKALGYSMMFYVFPFDDAITIEFRKYNPDAQGEPNRTAWQFRNYFWGTVGPKFAHDTTRDFSNKDIRYGLIDNFSAVVRFNLESLVKSDNTSAPDQMIRYPHPATESKYTFSLWAFPEDRYPAVLTDYFQFCRDYYETKGYRSNMLSVGYRIAQDQNALLSYSHDGAVVTVDPVSTGDEGWTDFLDAYNRFCDGRGGIPLLNQTPQLTPAMAKKAFGSKLAEMETARKTYDPGERLLNGYYRSIFQQ